MGRIAMIAMLDSLSSLMDVDSPAKFFVVIALISGVVILVTVIVMQLGWLASHRAELEFKRDLVERGLSVDEIERIVSAKPVSKAKPTRKLSTEVGASVARS
jgi:hypothetical protein